MGTGLRRWENGGYSQAAGVLGAGYGYTDRAGFFNDAVSWCGLDNHKPSVFAGGGIYRESLAAQKALRIPAEGALLERKKPAAAI